jgi:SAM-dependent methyltransferase
MAETLSFQRYLLAKRTLDDRSLNPHVWGRMAEWAAARGGLRIFEPGGGLGTMFQRLAEHGLLRRCEYTLLDADEANIAAAREFLPEWAASRGLDCASEADRLVFRGARTDARLELLAADMGAYLAAHPERKWDLIVAHAFLDLLDVPAALAGFKAALRPGGKMLLTLNFDGLTAFAPELDPVLDAQIIELYHRTMDEREGSANGGSLTGRRLFSWLKEVGLRIVDAGSSDWLVFAKDGVYPTDEAYFLTHILSFFRQSLRGRPDLAPEVLDAWLRARQEQIERGELVFMAHQYDFLVEADE